MAFPSPRSDSAGMAQQAGGANAPDGSEGQPLQAMRRGLLHAATLSGAGVHSPIRYGGSDVEVACLARTLLGLVAFQSVTLRIRSL